MSSINQWFWAIFALGGFALLVQPASAADRTMVYISAGGDSRVVLMELDLQTGGLESRGQFDLPGPPGAMTNDPQRKILYVGVRGENRVAALAISPKDGHLTTLGITPVTDIPTYLATDHQGRYLLVAYYRAAKAAVYPIKKDGTIDAKPASLIATDKNPHSIQADRSDRFVFIPNTGADKVLQYTFDATTGTLAPNRPPELETSRGTGPRHFWFHPTADVVYVVNEKGSSATTCGFDTRRGTLTSLQTISTLPAECAVHNSCAHIECTPDGKFLYASNRGHDSLAIFSIGDRGTLAFVGTQPTEKTPRAFAIDPSGQYLLAAGQGSKQLATYRIGPDGRLEPLAVYPAGKGPAWVQIVPLK